MQSVVESVFLCAHKQKGIGRNTFALQSMYANTPEEYKAQFRALAVERQIFLLAIPVKKQARFKREGVDTFVSGRKQNEP